MMDPCGPGCGGGVTEGNGVSKMSDTIVDTANCWNIYLPLDT